MILDHVGVNVADLPAMTRWYADALDLSVELETTVGAFDLSIVMLRSQEGHRIELLHRPGSVEGRRATDPPEAVLTRGFGHLALAVADVEATHAVLLASGATDRMSPRPSPESGVRMAFVADPEGNLIELVERGTP